MADDQPGSPVAGLTADAPADAPVAGSAARHRPARRAPWRDDDGHLRFGLLAVLVVGGALAVAYWPLLLGRVPLPIDIIFASPVFDGIREQFDISHNHAELGDLVAGFYPIHDYVGDALKSGDVPLWNPHVLMGSPLFAAYQPGMLYPPNLVLYGLLPTAAAWGLLFPLRLLIAGVGMALFVRSMDATRAGALTSGLAYAFCGYLLTWSGWPHVAVAAGLPWVLLALHRLRQTPSPGRAALLALAVAFPLLGGHPQTMVYVAGTAVAYALLLLTRPGRRLAFLAWAALGGVLGLGVAAAQLLPTAEWLGLISRDLSSRLAGHLPAWNALGLLSRDTRSSPNSILMNIPEAATYVGALTLVAASLAVFHRQRRREVVLFAVLGAGALCTAYGISPVYDVTSRLPVLSGLPSARTLVVAQVALCVLAGLGVSAWQQRLAHAERRTVAAWWGVLLGVGAACAYGITRLADRTTTVPPNGIRTVDYEVAWFRGPGATAVLLAVVLVALSPLLRPLLRRPRTGGLLASAVVLLLAADLVSYGYGHVPFAPRTAAYPTPPVLAALDERDPDVYRIASLASVYAKNLELAYDEDAPGGTGYNVEAVAPLLQPFGGGFFGFLLDPAKVASVDDRRLDLYGVRYLVASPYNKGDLPLRARPDRFEVVSESPAVVVFRNKTALPRAFVVAEEGRLDASVRDAYCILDDLEPTVQVVVSPAEGDVPAECPADRTGPALRPDPRSTAAVTDVRRAVDVVEVDLRDPTPGVLVLADVFYPGWEVTVDGEAREVLRVDGGFKGVRVGAGDGRVVFTYDPASWRTGRIISGLSLLVVLGLLLAGPLLRRRRRA